MSEELVLLQHLKAWLFYLHSKRFLRLSVNVFREMCSYLSPAIFPFIVNQTLRLYNLQTQMTTYHSLTVNFRGGGSFVLLDNNTMLCVGAYPETIAVYSLEITSQTLTSMPNMHKPRCHAGIAKASGCVYVFGGDYQGNKSCEKYHILDQAWQVTGKMQRPRLFFTPCVYQSLIYLVSAYPKKSRAVETFDPSSEQFTVLSVSLPDQIQLASVAFVTEGELWLLTTNKHAACWKIESSSSFKVYNTDKDCCSSQAPLVDDSVVLIANQTSEYWRLETWSLKMHSFLC